MRLSLAPLLAASLPIQIHVAAAVLTLVLGPTQFVLRKGTTLHRTVGWIWVLSLGTLCVTSLLIPGSLHLGPISVFHVLSVYTLWALLQGARAARQGDIESHRSYMTWIFGLSVVLSTLVAAISGGVLTQMLGLTRS